MHSETVVTAGYMPDMIKNLPHITDDGLCQCGCDDCVEDNEDETITCICDDCDRC